MLQSAEIMFPAGSAVKMLLDNIRIIYSRSLVRDASVHASARAWGLASSRVAMMCLTPFALLPRSRPRRAPTLGIRIRLNTFRDPLEHQDRPDEPSGDVTGLLRVRSFAQADRRLQLSIAFLALGGPKAA